MKRKLALGIAIYELSQLLEDKVLEEREYQKYFENHGIVFEILGYKKSYSMTSSGIDLPRDEHTNLKPEPDFIVLNEQNLYEIFEIKTPIDKNLVIDKNTYRIKFNSAVCSYISQTITYDDYFSGNPSNRNYLKINHGIDLQVGLDIKIIIGRNSSIDRGTIHKKCREYNRKIDIITFDDILEKLKTEYSKHYGIHEGLVGLSLHLIIRIHLKESTGYIVDIGEGLNKDRISLFIDDNNHLQFVAIDSTGFKHSVSVSNQSKDFIGNCIYLSCEFGSSQDQFIMSASINGLEAQKTIKNCPIKIDDALSEFVIGADKNQKHFSKFDLAEMVITGSTLELFDRINLYRYFNEKYGLEINSVN